MEHLSFWKICIGKLIGIGIDNPITEIIIVAVILIEIICIHPYMIRRPGTMKAKAVSGGSI
jgi:hypothetical protein